MTERLFKFLGLRAWDGRRPPVTAESIGIVPRRPTVPYTDEIGGVGVTHATAASSSGTGGYVASVRTNADASH
jgi:hypothetical protein